MRLGQRTVSYQAYISFGFPFINPPLVSPMRDALIQSLVYGLARKAAGLITEQRFTFFLDAT